jgi:type II secretory pathway component PulF
VFLILAIVIVLVYVIPAISQLFSTSEVELPFATRALIASSNFMVYNWFIVILFVVTILVLFFGYKNTERGRVNWDYFLLKLPLG